MKKILVVIIFGLLLCSCREVSFKEPQPMGVEPLQSVPPLLLGRYVVVDENGTDTDTLTIEPWGYHFRDSKDKEWLGKGMLNDSLVLKTYENYYFVNFRSGKQWILRLIKRKPSGDIEFMSINLRDEKKRSSVLKKLSKTFVVKEIQIKDDTYYQINPTKEQLLQLIKDGYFSGDILTKVQ